MTAPTTVDDRETVARVVSAAMDGIYGDDDPVRLIVVWMHRSKSGVVKIVSNIPDQEPRRKLLEAAITITERGETDPPVDVSKGNG